MVRSIVRWLNCSLKRRKGLIKRVKHVVKACKFSFEKQTIPFFVPCKTIKISSGNKYKYNKRNPRRALPLFTRTRTKTGATK